jgi:molybdate transport system permease protein
MNVDFWSPIILSIKIAVIAGLLVTFIGTLVARVMAKKQFFGKTVVETFLMLPLVLPPTVIGFLLIIIFGRTSPIGKLIETIFQQPLIFTWYAAIVAATVVAFPLMYQAAKTGFELVEPDIEAAARIDGANDWNVFMKVTIPLAYKAIIAGSILGFTRALGEFGATLMFAGNIPGKTQTIPTAIYVAIDSGDFQLAWLWVTASITISFLLLIGINKIKT